MNSPVPDAPGTLERAGDTVSAPQPERPSASRIFGAVGLRAVGGVLLFVFLCEVLSYCVYSFLIGSRYLKMAVLPPRVVFLSEGAGLACILTATFLMSRIECRPVADYGLRPQGGLRNFCAGLVWGVALLSLLVLLLRAGGVLFFDARLVSGGAVLRYGLLWLAGFLLVGLQEEIFNRGYLQFTLTRGLGALYQWMFGPRYANALGFWTAAFALSYLFGISHGGNPGESPTGLLFAGLAGFLFCFSLWRTGSLWWAIGFHAAWDWAESFLYGVPDSGLVVQGHLFATHIAGRTWLSGGTTGPEGSLLALPILFLGAGVVLLTLPRTHFGYAPAGAQPARLN